MKQGKQKHTVAEKTETLTECETPDSIQEYIFDNIHKTTWERNICCKCNEIRTAVHGGHVEQVQGADEKIPRLRLLY